GDISLQGHPESFQLELRGSRIFVNVPAARHVVVIDRDKERAIAQWPTGARDNFPMTFDEAGRRLYVGCRNPAQVLVFDTESGKAVARLDSPGDADDLFFDPAARRLYVSGGNGNVSVFERITGDEHRLLGKIETAGMARTSLLVPETGFFYVAAPHMLPLAHEAQIRVFKVKP
ncbi:MAG: hypothetical protein IMZ62_11975, partial [Chloroflexi bacterium]|nr:hypothetical protein [Chloroflexota bacterium]